VGPVLRRTGREIGQIEGDFQTADVVKNDYIDAANTFRRGAGAGRCRRLRTQRRLRGG
jgi:hypothetical protein